VPSSLDNTTTTNTTSAAGSDQTDLLAGGAVAGHRGRVANVLMVTTSVRVLNGVAGNTSDLRPAVVLRAEAVVGVTSLEDGLLNSATSGDEANHGTACRRDGLLLAGGQFEAGAVRLGVVGDDDAVITAGASEGATVTELGLNVADDATLGDVAKGEDIADGELRLGAAVDCLASEHAFSGDEELLDAFVLVDVAELNASEGSTTAGIVLDVLHDASHEAVALVVVENTEAGRAKALVTVNFVEGTLAVAAGKNGLTHGSFLAQ